MPEAYNETGRMRRFVGVGLRPQRAPVPAATAHGARIGFAVPTEDAGVLLAAPPRRSARLCCSVAPRPYVWRPGVRVRVW
jgi:hypothetical protein